MASGSSARGVVVVAVRDHNDRLPHRSIRLHRQHLVTAGLIDGVEEGSAPTRPQTMDRLVQQIDVVGVVLLDIGTNIEARNKRCIGAVQHLEKELGGGVLFELESVDG